LPATPAFEPHELHFTSRKSDDLLRGLSRVFHTHATTKPVLTLYDPGFSGNVMISSKLAHSFKLPIEPIHQDIILADGTVVKCEGIVRGVNFSPVEGFVETCDALVFPLATYHVIIGMAWLKHHHARIFCRENLIKFFSPDVNPYDAIDDVGVFSVHCSAAPHQDLSCFSVQQKSDLHYYIISYVCLCV
jgi:hypothetical protein